MLVHNYPPLLLGKLVKRYKRFFADIELESGEIITAHCANTGPMTDISTIGSVVGVSQSSNPKRKLPYSWEIIKIDQTWVGVHTGLPNQVIGYMLRQHLIPELEPYETVQPEVAYGSENSRIDFVLTAVPPLVITEITAPQTAQLVVEPPTLVSPLATQTYVEVKNTTWTKGNLALFPDTVTTRGQKHLRELISIVNSQTKSALIYFINRGDCDRFAPGAEADPLYAKLLEQAIAAGVKVLPCRFQVSPTGIEYLGLAELAL